MDVDYQVIYAKRKTVTISVERDRKIIVRVPEGLSEEKIAEIVAKKKNWITEKINHNQKYNINTGLKEFVSGETLLYLGKNYQLQVTEDTVDGIVFDRRFYISKNNQPKAKDMFKKWFKKKATEKIAPLAKKYAEKLGVSFNTIKISDMKYRWGSCTPGGNLLFNWRLIKAPVFVIEYVVVHELSHLIEHNHSADFWNIVSVQLPHYDKAKAWLKKHGEILEIDF